ncbi:hypothetical protein Q0Z83_044020 [Actinoplanes sichuanensis]|uniref:Restriction endonuclease n=1 Tax=Actinoplanes sichuanensis TaxID=512349 RepID=A0ABW4AU14_9ACTN|nr:restriction endonuclease [Actinoplanes sichuanensis]BEL06211.1 hypothetical protein Q0Z83_044020 [Actinoplanes sichuanensis]
MSAPTGPEQATTSAPKPRGPGNGRLAVGVALLVLAVTHQAAGHITHPVARVLDLLIFGGSGVLLIHWWRLRRGRYRADPTAALPGPSNLALTTGLIGLVCAFGASETALSPSGSAGLSDDERETVLGMGTLGAVLLSITALRIRYERRRPAETPAAVRTALPVDDPPASAQPLAAEHTALPVGDPPASAEPSPGPEHLPASTAAPDEPTPAGVTPIDATSQEAAADFLHDDARTVWAYRRYCARRQPQGISETSGRALLAALEPGDHVELIADAVATDETDLMDAADWKLDDAEPVVAVRTLRGWILIDRHEGEVVLAPGPADGGITVSTALATSRPDIGRAATLRTSDGRPFTMKVFFDERDGVDEKILEEGAGAYIRRLPEADAVPPMPDAAAFLAAAATRPAEPVRPSLPTDWRTAEEIACVHMRGLGFQDAETTPPGRDGGLDVTASGAVAQVKMPALPVGAPAVQQLRGTRPLTANHLFYSTSGYTAAAVEAADEIGVALFRIERDGAVNEVNGHAIEVVRAGAAAGPDAVTVVSEAAMTRHVTAYADAVAARIMNATKHTDQDRTHEDQRYSGQWHRMVGYLHQALENLKERPSEFPSLRAAMIYYHHTELLAHVFFQELGVAYPEGGGVTDDDLSSYYT